MYFGGQGKREAKGRGENKWCQEGWVRHYTIAESLGFPHQQSALFCWENKSVLKPSQMPVSHVFQQQRRTIPVSTCLSSHPGTLEICVCGGRRWGRVWEALPCRGSGSGFGTYEDDAPFWPGLEGNRVFTKCYPNAKQILGIWSNVGQTALMCFRWEQLN